MRRRHSAGHSKPNVSGSVAHVRRLPAAAAQPKDGKGTQHPLETDRNALSRRPLQQSTLHLQTLQILRLCRQCARAWLQLCCRMMLAPTLQQANFEFEYHVTIQFDLPDIHGGARHIRCDCFKLIGRLS
jgi:hypothetical protein